MWNWYSGFVIMEEGKMMDLRVLGVFIFRLQVKLLYLLELSRDWSLLLFRFRRILQVSPHIWLNPLAFSSSLCLVLFFLVYCLSRLCYCAFEMAYCSTRVRDLDLFLGNSCSSKYMLLNYSWFWLLVFEYRMGMPVVEVWRSGVRLIARNVKTFYSSYT